MILLYHHTMQCAFICLGLFLAKYSLALTLVACVCQFHRIKETQIIYSKYGHILTKISIPLYSDTHLCMLIGCTSKWLLMRSTTIYWNYFWPIVILSIVNLVIFILNWFSFEYIYADVSYSPVSRDRNYLNIVNIVLYNCVTIRSINYSPKLDFKSIFGFSNAFFNTNTNLSIPLSKNPHSYQWQFGNFIEQNSNLYNSLWPSDFSNRNVLLLEKKSKFVMPFLLWVLNDCLFTLFQWNS